jgi:hypothetical protein
MAWQDALPWNIVPNIARGIGRAYASPEKPDAEDTIINPQTTGLATKTPLGDFLDISGIDREGFYASPASRNANGINPVPAEPLIGTPAPPVPSPIYPTGHHPSKYPEAKDRYDWAEKIPDKAFKEFIDKHDDTSPHVKGLGYIETIDPVTQKPRFEKVISRPEPGGESPAMQDMNPAQFTALSHAITGIGGIGQTSDIERKKLEHLIAQSDMKNPDARVKLLRDIAISGGEKRYILDEDKIKIGEQTVPDYEGAAAIIKAVTGHDLSSSIPKKAQAAKQIIPKKGEERVASDGTKAVFDGTKWIKK